MYIPKNFSTVLFVCLLGLIAPPAHAADANRLTYLDSSDPYYVSRGFPRLITPQWVGEEGVDAVVILAIDDMRGHEKWETFLRPILDRLKKIDGRAPVSIMTCKIDPADPHLQTWLKEGVSLETHTYDHPCPLMADGNFERAKMTYDKCVDQMFDVPNNVPVAFRIPCCDSLNTPSPRFFAEIFNRVTPRGRFLTADSSIVNIITPNDPDQPRETVFDPDGREKFRKYLPFKSFVNTVEDYPYPFVINRLCWEFPCAVPSDWEGFHINKAFNPQTVQDMKAAIDAVVTKKGVFDLVFHPHGWIKPEQVIELIDHATGKYGKRVKFLTFREAQDRINHNLLADQPLRAANGNDNGVRLLDVDNDGFLDVVIGNDNLRQTRIWSPATNSWITSDFPAKIVTNDKNGDRSDAGVRFGVLHSDGRATAIVRNESAEGAWHFDGKQWEPDPSLFAGLNAGGPIFTSRNGRDQGVRLRDLDRDGRCELIVSNDRQEAIFSRDAENTRWTKLPFTLPVGTAIVDADGRDAGLRFVDINEDAYDDVIFSNDHHYSLHLFSSMKEGWSHPLLTGVHGEQPIADEIPKIVRNGTNNGAWIHSRHIWWRNESTAALPDLVDRRSFAALLGSSEPEARSPEASLKSIRVAPGFEVELVVAEPLVEDPIAFAWGADGKLWVVEMGDYPLGLDGKGKPGGKIKFLESTHGDGKYDKATVFLDNLPFPTGVMPWHKGVLVTCAPEIFYAEDTKGSGKADLRVPLFTGFQEGNQQHRVNSLVPGLDNWIYCANGHSGGKITSVKTGAMVDISGRDLRIRPDEGLLEATTGITQYGRARDDWGNWFGNDNSNPMYHFVLDDHYLRRNPNVAAPRVTVQISDHPGAARVYPISRTLARFNDLDAANHFTSANSAIVYRDNLFGPFSNSTFVSEPVHNLVHREVIAPSGVTFASHRAKSEEESEFFASTDNWTRPTMLQTGPDGALWVADMYRAVIEHPQWIPLDWQKKLDLRAGSDKGRIYRIFPVGQKPRPIPRLDKLDIPALVAALDSPSGWQRDTVQQLLIERHDPAAIPLLQRQAIESANPLCRLHSLCTLDGLAAVDEPTLRNALADSQPALRRHAIRISEPFLVKSPEFGKALIQLLADPDPQVQMQLAYSLGYWNDPAAGTTLGRLAAKNADDRFIVAAVMSSLTKENIESFATELTAGMKDSAPPAGLLDGLTRSAHSLGGPALTLRLLAAAAPPAHTDVAAWRFDAAAAILDALEASGTSIAKLSKDAAPDSLPHLKTIDSLFDAARNTSADAQAPLPARVSALRLLGRAATAQKEDVVTLASFLSPRSQRELQAAAAETLARRRDAQTPPLLLHGWATYSPALRTQIIDALLSRDAWGAAVLDSIERREMKPTEIDPARRQRLLHHKDPAVRARAIKLLAAATNADRTKVVASYADALTLKGDAVHGREVFAKTCAVCHRLGDVGASVGPDLASIGNKLPEGLLTSILDPNQAVEPRYTGYLVETLSGDSYTGVLAGETGNGITLAVAGGEQKTFLRSDLKTLRSTGLSLMPEGLESALSRQDVADLIAAIRGSAPPRERKKVDGNQPELVRADSDGVLHLLATNCEIYGKTLTFEPRYGNLGFWTSEDDQAVWSAEIPSAGQYTVTLHYACDEASAGNAFVLQCGKIDLPGTVSSTHNWDTYTRMKIGEMTLPAGRQQFTFRATGKLKGALIDLTDIVLKPAK